MDNQRCTKPAGALQRANSLLQGMHPADLRKVRIMSF